jgi:hypothetical protein
MKKQYLFHLCLTLALYFLGSQSAFAQVPNSEPNASTSGDTTKYVVIRNNGIEYVGLLLSDDGREVLIMTQTLGKVYIPKSEIKSIKPLDYSEEVKKGEYTGGGVFSTRYQFTTSCFPIKKGENYAMVNLYGPEVHFAVHKDFSVGVMSTWIGSPLALAFKYTRGTSNPKINYGFGTLIGTSGYFNQAKSLGGLHWGMLTRGTRTSNITLSLGFAFLKFGPKEIQTEYIYQPGTYPSVDQVPLSDIKQIENKNLGTSLVIGVAGQTKVGKKTSLVYDCMFLRYTDKSRVGYQPFQSSYSWWDPTVTVPVWQLYPPAANVLILMPGMRFQKSDTRAFQISLAGVITDNISFPLPMLSWFFKI